MSSLIPEHIVNTQTRWQQRLSEDSELSDAWNNVLKMMYKGSIPSLEGAAKLILQMEWCDGLSTWIELDNTDTPLIRDSVHLEERSLHAFVLLRSRHDILSSSTQTWFHLVEEHIDWGQMAVLAASLPSLGEIPEWLLEDLILGSTQEVCIPLSQTEHLYMQRYPVIQALFEAIVGENPSVCLGQTNPVDSLSWYEALHFCNQLSDAMGYACVYQFLDNGTIHVDDDADGYHLPTPNQWTLAAKHLSPQTQFAGDNELWKVGIYDSDASDSVGRHASTPGGLYDMSGNIWEWCWDADSNLDSLYAPRKGGSWASMEQACRIDVISSRLKTFISPTQGLRLCRHERGNQEKPSSNHNDGWDW